MYRIFLYSVIIVACGVFGLVKGERYRERRRILEDYDEFLTVLQAELKYSMAPIPEILRELGDRKNTKAYKLAKYVYDLYILKDEEISSAYAHGMDEIYDKSAINMTDKSIMNETAEYLGRFAIEGKEKLFEITQARIKTQIAEAASEEKSKGKMCRSLGFSIGIILVIILI